MFYSHEVLTSRKYGVATVWLVATLGSKTSLKRVSRKAILDVDITKTCETIAEPTVPMALRLQSSLLFGVTRVYSQQCGYVLADAESARNDMRALAKALRTSASTLAKGNKGRADHLMLNDDPNYLPDIDLALGDLDLDNLTLQQDSNATSYLSSTAMSQSSFGHVSLDVPSLRSPSAQRSLSGSVRHDRHSNAQSRTSVHEGLQDDLDLDFLDNTEYDLMNVPEAMPDVEEEEPQNEPRTPVYHDDDIMPNFAISEPNVLAEEDAEMQDDQPSVPQVATTSSTASAALQRGAATKKSIPLDDVTQLRGRILKDWSTNYLALMDEQRKQRIGMAARSLAKENAHFWFYGNHALFTLADIPGPIFARRPEKRAREEHDDHSSERRIKSRRESSQPVSVAAAIEDTFTPYYDEIEVGRAQGTPLPERHSTLLPWSQSTQSMMRQSRVSSLQPQHLVSPTPAQHLASEEAEFKMYGPAGQIDTQTAAESQWLRSTLEGESINFMRYLESAVDQRQGTSIGFADLLPHAEHTAIVAAQAFMHVLALGTRGLLEAVQIEPLDDIQLRVL